MGEAETALSCFIPCFLWVCILCCNSLTGSLLSFGGIRWKWVCVLRDNMGQVQGLLIEFLLTFHIHSESQPEQGLLTATFVPPLHPLPPLLTALTSLQSCFPIQTVTLIRNWCDSTTGRDKHVVCENILRLDLLALMQGISNEICQSPDLLMRSTWILLEVWHWIRESWMWR